MKVDKQQVAPAKKASFHSDSEAPLPKKQQHQSVVDIQAAAMISQPSPPPQKKEIIIKADELADRSLADRVSM